MSKWNGQMGQENELRQVSYLGQLVEISDREYRIMSKRGHLKFLYKMVPRVKPERCLEMRDVLLSTKI